MRRLCITLRLHGRVMDKLVARLERRWHSAPLPFPFIVVPPSTINIGAFERAWKIAGRL